MSYRKLQIDNEEWKYTIGKSMVKIVPPEGKSLAAPVSEVATSKKPSGVYMDDYYSWSVTPQDIKKFILSNLHKF